MGCFRCGNAIGLLRQHWDEDFCSDAHRREYHAIMRAALARLAVSDDGSPYDDQPPFPALEGARDSNRRPLHRSGRRRLLLPRITPAAASAASDPFNRSEWLFEIKYDGLRGIAYIDGEWCRMLSRDSDEVIAWPDLCESVATALSGQEAILDGEIVCLDSQGHPQFEWLFDGRTKPCYVAFDCLWLNGRDLRPVPLIERKRMLRTLLPENADRLFRATHAQGRGLDLYRAVCDGDLEGIVAKDAFAPYGTDSSSWLTVDNPSYSQRGGRDHHIEEIAVKRRQQSPERNRGGNVIRISA